MAPNTLRSVRRLAVFGTVAWVCVAAHAWLAPVASAAAKGKIASAWRDREVTVDGTGTDWTQPVPLVKKSPFSIAVANDEAFLYVALGTSTASTITQMIREGLVVWLDATGGKKKTFGVKYPVGVTSGERGRGGPGAEGRPPAGASAHLAGAALH